MCFAGKILAWIQTEQAATAIEYALLAAGMAMACTTAIFLLGDDIGTVFDALGTSMSSAQGRIETS